MRTITNERFEVVPDPENEQFKIIDRGTVVGTEDKDNVWFASAFDYNDACLIAHLLNSYRPIGASTDQK